MALRETSLGDTWADIAALFVLFSLFLLASIGCGAWVRRRIFSSRPGLLDEAGDAVLLATLLLYAVAFSLASTRSLSLVSGWVYGLLFYPGLVVSLPFVRDLARATWNRRRLALFVFSIVFFVRALSAALPLQHGDPLLYHLLGPRLWAEHGGFYMDVDLPNALLASTWECLYVWPEVFFLRGTPLYGLVEAQIFSQWIHLFFAWGGSALLVMRLFRGSVREAWLPLIGLAALFVSGLQWTAPLAKNDAGIAFWSLGAIVFFTESLRESGRWKAALSGVFAGLALAGKITALFTLAPVLGLLLLALGRGRGPAWIAKSAALWALGFALGAFPAYARNYLLSGNPFFPLFPKVFPSHWISRSWEAHFAQVHPSSPLHSLGRLFTRLPDLFRETYWVAGALLLLAIYATRRYRQGLGRLARPEIIALVAGAFASYAIFSLTQAPEIELRYLAAALMLLAAAGVALVLWYAERLGQEPFRRLAAGAVLVIVLATSRLPLHIIRKIWHEPLGVAYVKTHSAGEAKAWVRAQGRNHFTVLAGDNETYYLTPSGVAVLTERPDFDSLYDRPDFASFLAELCRLSRARYLLDARPAIGVEARFGAAPLAPAKVFSAQGANVYDLHLLSPQCR